MNAPAFRPAAHTRWKPLRTRRAARRRRHSVVSNAHRLGLAIPDLLTLHTREPSAFALTMGHEGNPAACPCLAAASPALRRRGFG